MSTPSSQPTRTPPPDGEDEALIAALVELGRALTLDGDPGEAEVVWYGLIELAPTLELPWRALATLAAAQGRWGEVPELAGQAVARADSLAARLLAAEALRHGGRYAEAATEVAAGLALPEASPELRARARAMARR